MAPETTTLTWADRGFDWSALTQTMPSGAPARHRSLAKVADALLQNRWIEPRSSVRTETVYPPAAP